MNQPNDEDGNVRFYEVIFVVGLVVLLIFLLVGTP